MKAPNPGFDGLKRRILQQKYNVGTRRHCQARDHAFMRAAIIHYWLLNMRGGEKVLDAFCRLLPDADIFTLFYDPR